MKFAFSLLVSVALTSVLVPTCGAQPAVAVPAQELVAPKFPAPVDGRFAEFALPPVLPAAVPATSLNFSNLVAAKIDSAKNPPQIILMVESYRLEVKKVDVMRPVQKKVTQTYTKPNGEAAEREVTVMQLVSEKVEQTVAIAAGLKPKVMQLADFQFYDVDAKPVSHDDAAKALAKLQPVFLLGGYTGEVEPLGKYERQVLKPDVLIVATKQIVNDHPQPNWQNVAVPIGFAPALPMQPQFRGLGVPQPVPIQPADQKLQAP